MVHQPESYPRGPGWMDNGGLPKAPKIASTLLVFATAWVLGGCATHAPAILPVLPGGSAAIELSAIPFYPAKDHGAGPAALAMMLAASGVSPTPAELASLLYSPPRHDTVGALAALAPRFGRLGYRIAPDLPALMAELAAGHPVLVQLSHGRSLLSEWHFAVVVGYDVHTDTIVVRAANRRRDALRSRDFMDAWSNADRWGMLVLRPGDLPAAVSTESYLRAAIEFERHARPEDSRLVFEAALRRWPDEPLAWMGRAVARLQAGDQTAAASDFVISLRIDGSNALARNGLALTLLDLGCIHEAQNQIDKIREYVLADPLRSTIEGSRDRISARLQVPIALEPAVCTKFSPLN
jgi:hypothetical protein